MTGNNFYIIVEGEVNVYKTKPMSNGMPSVRIASNDNNENFLNNPKEELVATLKKGQYFGEKALLKEDVRQASCVSKTDVVCLTLGRDDFVSMIGHIDELDRRKDSPTTRSLKTHNEVGVSSSNPAPAVVVAEGSKQPSDDKSKQMLNSASTPTLPPPKNETPSAVQPVPAAVASAEKIQVNAEVPTSARDPFAKLDRTINLSNMKMMRIIGRGAFGHVKLATYVSPNSKNGAKEYYALKCQSKSAIVENGLKKHVSSQTTILL